MAFLETPSNLKLCTKCIHYYAATVRGKYMQVCRHPLNVVGWSLVDGSPILNVAECSLQRDGKTLDTHLCGVEGKRHETTASLGAPDSKSTLAALKRITADDL